MSSDRSSLTENQQKVKKYFEKHNIEETISDILNTLAHNQDEKPLIFMIKYLINLCPKEDLETAGVSINGAIQSSQSILAIVYPDFDPLCNNLFKNYLSKDVFMAIKNKKTPKLGNSIRPMLQAGIENQGSRFGCYLPDPEAYETFQMLLGPIVEEINQGVNVKGFKYSREAVKVLKETKLTEEMQYIKSLKVKVKRNLDGFGFNLVNNGEVREKIKDKLLSGLKKVGFEKSFSLEGAMEEEEKRQWLTNRGFFNFKKNPFIRQGSRFKEWPHGRALALNSEKGILAWVNKEDHLELISVNANFKQTFIDLFTILDKLDEELHFAFSDKLGFFTSKPNFLGIGLTFNLGIEIPEEFIGIFNENLQLLFPNLLNIEIKEQDAKRMKWNVFLKKNAGINVCSLIPQLDSIIYTLFNGIVNKDSGTVRTKKGVTFESCLKNKAVYDEECYDLFQQQIIEKMIIRKTADEFTKPINTLLIKETLKNDIVLQTYGMVMQSFFVVRRNISTLNFKGNLSESDLTIIDDILLSFIKKLPSEHIGNISSIEEKEHESRVKLFLEQYRIQSVANHRVLNQSTPYGSKLYTSVSQELNILSNYEDHFLLVFEFKSHSILKALQRLELLLKIFDKSVQEANLSIAQRPGIGFLTLNPNFTGLGISLNYTLKLRERNQNEMQIEPNPEENFYTHGEVKDVLKVQLDRMTPQRVEDFLKFLQGKLTEQKSFQTKEIFSQLQSEGHWTIITQQLLTNYSHFSLKEGLCFLDCFDPENSDNLLALHESCYDAFSGVYDSFISINCSQKWNVPVIEADVMKVVEEKLYSWPEFKETSTMTIEIGRNLKMFPFKPFLSWEAISQIKNRLFDGLKPLKLFTMIEEKYIATSSLDRKLFPSDYQRPCLEQNLIKGGVFVLVPEHNTFAIWGLLQDHIRIVLSTNPERIKKDLLEILNILAKVEKTFEGGFNFHKNYGYLAENARDVGFNVRITLETAVERKKSDVVKQFCKSAGWGYSEKADLGAEKITLSIKVRKPSFLVEELELLGNLMKGLSEN